MAKKKCYISGKITDLAYEVAYSNFLHAEKCIKKLGFEPVNPMKLVPFNESYTWEDYMTKDLEILLHCDCIYMQNNWETSKGARVERSVAFEMELPIYYQEK